MTNSNLITVFNGQISNQSAQLANARDLHTFLEVGKVFGAWIQDRITDYGFIENEDYIIVTERTAGRPRKEYHITLDMGKELAMVERNDKGRQIRKYFIECEKQARLQNQQQSLPLVEEKKYTFDFTEKELQQLAWLWFALDKCVQFVDNVANPLHLLGSSFSPRAHGIKSEYSLMLKHFHPLIDRLTADFKIDTWGDSNWNRVLPTIRNFGKPIHQRLR